ncbi:MAG TPA: hypothetical protein PLQ09_06055 [Prolixibacteraceae bacterium]|nr:hypothetical protein [Bacteroidales bacterium]HQN93660.1 hypothetical protein [Prolixibacteraceae bacterium]
MNKLINPFKYIAGWESFFIGLGILFATAFVGYLSGVHFPDLISVKTSSGLPFIVILAQSISNWLVLSALLYFAGIVLSPSSIRFIDVFGTQAMARFPYLLVASTGFSPALEKFGKHIMWSALSIGEPTDLSSVELTTAIILIIFTLLSTIWLITLAFNAFKVSTNLKEAKLIISFIVIFIVSTIITGFISNNILKAFNVTFS